MNFERIAEIARENYVAAVEKNYGAAGMVVVRELLARLKGIHAVVDYESISGSLTVFKTIDDGDRPIAENSSYRLTGTQDIPVHNKGTLTIHILDNDKVLLWKVDTSPVELTERAIIYRYDPGKGERIWVEGLEYGANVPGYPQLFGSPTFLDLAQALDHYAITHARSSECPYLTQAWREGGRVMWKAKPERHMRLSLHQFLRSALRDGRPDVLQEAPADDRNPVDITVRWADSNRIALIEIKWIGRSGLLDPPVFKTEYKERRAQDGLRQLAEYLDLTRARAPKFDRRGYLVVYDGRRANIRVDDVRCDRDSGMAFADAHISYDQGLLDRHDVAEPVRFFCEPKWVFNSPSKGG